MVIYILFKFKYNGITEILSIDFNIDNMSVL